MAPQKKLLLLFSLLTLSACKVVITTPSQGGVATQSGNFTCPAASQCEVDVPDFLFNETFIAVPEPGYTFRHWQQADRAFCGGEPQPCHLFTQGLDGPLANFIDNILATDTTFYLSPVFADAAAGGGAITIATFNIQTLGTSKMSKPAVVAKLVEKITAHSIVAVQEIKDVSNRVPFQLLDAINAADGPDYALALSERGGKQADDANYQEQYAYYYNTELLELVTDYGLYPDARDRFQREPYIARFRAKGGGFSFVLITVHTSPGVAAEEIIALDEVFLWAQTVAGTEDDFIALGDFNQGCSYVGDGDLAEENIVRNYTYLVPDTADTNFSENTACAYDRIVITRNTAEEYAGAWGIDPISDRAVSDHFPVWARFAALEVATDSQY